MDGSSVFYETYSVLLELNRIIKAFKIPCAYQFVRSKIFNDKVLDYVHYFDKYIQTSDIIECQYISKN